jgi:pilus assembly protein Flp/PilA
MPGSKAVKERIELLIAQAPSGVTAIEYALIASLIAVAAIASFSLVGTNLSNTFSNIASCL